MKSINTQMTLWAEFEQHLHSSKDYYMLDDNGDVKTVVITALGRYLASVSIL